MHACGHAISWPVLRAVRRRHSSLTILHIDAHPDMYDAYRAIRAPTPRPLPASWKRGLPTA
nr:MULTISPECIES: arginase family protein [unclassified Mesorhizobium]